MYSGPKEGKIEAGITDIAMGLTHKGEAQDRPDLNQ
jgi:hypothetical protein